MNRKKNESIELSNASIRRLARKGGVRRISSDTYDPVRELIATDIDRWLTHSLAFTARRNNNTAVTMNLDDLENGAKSMGQHLAFAGKSRHHALGKAAEGKVHQEKVTSYATHVKKTSEPRKTDRKFHPGTVALREIKYYQAHSEDYVLSHATFVRLVRAIARDSRFTEEVLYVLQDLVESEMVECFTKANLAVIHAKRVTVRPSDLHITKRIITG